MKPTKKGRVSVRVKRFVSNFKKLTCNHKQQITELEIGDFTIKNCSGCGKTILFATEHDKRHKAVNINEVNKNNNLVTKIIEKWDSVDEMPSEPQTITEKWIRVA